MSNNLLEIKNLSVAVSELSKDPQPFIKKLVNPKKDTVQLLRNINICIKKGEILGLIGESGSGKSLAVKSILGLYVFSPGIISGEITYYNETYNPLLKSNYSEDVNIFTKLFYKLFGTQKYQTAWHLDILNGVVNCPQNYTCNKDDKLFIFSQQNHDYIQLNDLDTLYCQSKHYYKISKEYTDYTKAYLTGWASLPNFTSFNDQIRRNLLKYKRMGRPIQGKEISMILQDPATFLNPFWSIKRQLANIRSIYNDASNGNSDVKEILRELRLDNDSFLNAKPRELSGGQAQRAMIILSRLTEANLLIADEPTTGLDVTLKRIVVDFFKQYKKSMIFISHDLNMVRRVADRINVMYNGEIIENCRAIDFISTRSHHPYAEKLINIQNSDYESFIDKEQLNRRDIQDYQGCSFALQHCPYRITKCENISPPPINIKSGTFCEKEPINEHWVKCWRFLPDE